MASVALLLFVQSCASIPARRFGMHELRFSGTEQMDPRLIEPCLATKTRPKVSLAIEPLRGPGCNEPPFEVRGFSTDLYSWPWKDWPLYDATVFDLDLERIERWYQARGFYDVRIMDVEYSHAEADSSSRAPCEEGCELDIEVNIQEGDPVRIRSIEFVLPEEELGSEICQDAREAVQLEEGERWDESLYRRAEHDLIDVLREEGYARARVEGDVRIDRAAHTADITMNLDPGPIARYGPVRVESPSNVPEDVVLAAAALEEGERYQHSELQDAQRSVYALGSFAAVTVREDRSDLGEDDHTIPIVIEVTPRRERELFFGVGLMSGVMSTGPRADEQLSLPQWDVHGVARYEHRNFMGGLRKLRLEEHPRLIFLGPFPTRPGNSPRFGNLVSAHFEQPGVFDSRTTLFADTSHDYGPDPFQLFFRHLFDVSVGVRRGFWMQRLQVELSLHQEIMQVPGRQPLVDDPPSSYRLPFVEQRITLDAREEDARGTLGYYLSVRSQQAFLLWKPGWNYVRIQPQVRGYAPLGLGITLAARFGVGSMHIFRASAALDDEAQRLGPQDYRQRGGGAQGNRGFAAGRLGDSIQGGLRSWLGSLELRVPLGGNLSIAGFTDVGDVNSAPSFRWSHLNTAVGGGIRYDTLIGPIRFDVGYRPESLQRTDGSEVADPFYTDLGFTRFRGAMHLTIGDSF